MSVCVIIPMLGFGETTKNCIDFTLLNAGIPVDILVVDDGSPEPFEDSRVSVLRLEKNTGFTNATNQGLLWAIDKKYDYVLLLNNDTEPEPDFAKILMEQLQADPEIGIAGSARIIYGQNNEPFIENFGIDLISGYQSYTKQDLPDDRVYVSWIPICSALIPMSVIHHVGLLDRRMKIYCSDNDYCIRAQELGYRVALVPKSKVKHFHQKTTTKMNCFPQASLDQKILLEKLCCHLRHELLNTYPLDWQEKTWGRLDFLVFSKKAGNNGHLDKPATAELSGRQA